MVTVDKNGHGELSSNPGRRCLCFIWSLCFWEMLWILCKTRKNSKSFCIYARLFSDKYANCVPGFFFNKQVIRTEDILKEESEYRRKKKDLSEATENKWFIFMNRLENAYENSRFKCKRSHLVASLFFCVFFFFYCKKKKKNEINHLQQKRKTT